MRWQGKWRVWGEKDMLAKFCWGSLRGKDNLEDVGVDGRIILKCALKK